MEASAEIGEFEAYKIKTKEWQAKVKERDIKMRAQIQSLSEEVAAKASEISNLKSQILSQDALTGQVKESHAMNQFKEEEVKELTNKLANSQKSIHEYTAKITSLENSNLHLKEMLGNKEIEHATHNDEMLRIQQRIHALELANVDLQNKVTGEHIISASDASVRVAVDVEGYGTYYCVVGGGSCHWSSHPINGQPTPESINRQLAKAKEELKDINREIAALIATHQAELEAAQSSAQELIKESAKGAQMSNFNVLLSHIVEAEDMTRQWQSSRCENDIFKLQQGLMRQLTSYYAHKARALQADVKELTDYKSKAQLLLRSKTNDVDPTAYQEKIHNLEKEQSERQSELALLREKVTESENKQKELEGVMLELQTSLRQARLEADRAKQLTFEFSKAQQTPSSTTSQTTQTIVRSFANASIQTIPIDACSENRQVSDTKTPSRSLPSPPAALPTVHEPIIVQEPLQRSQVSSLPITAPEFSLQNLLSAHSADSTIHNFKPQPNSPMDDVNRLKTELRRMSTELLASRSEIRDLTLQEQRNAEQVALLKDQLRSIEKTNQLDKELTHHGEYLKNVVLKLLSVNDADIKRGLIPIIGDILHFSPSELQTLMSSM